MAIKNLFLAVGIPASGKTTWAKAKQGKYAVGNLLRFNRDDIRLSVFNVVFDVNIESHVSKIQQALVKEALISGYDVVIDDTNINPRTRRLWHKMAQAVGDVNVVEVPIPCAFQEAKKRNSLRERPVPDDVMDRFLASWQENIKSTDIAVTSYSATGHSSSYTYPNPLVKAAVSKPSAVICDLDGTLAHLNGRDPYDQAKCGEDKVNEVLRDMLVDLHNKHSLVFVSGRDGTYFPQTAAWLNSAFPPGTTYTLYMRPAGDKRPDEVIKKELYQRNIEPAYNVVAVFDDRPKVVRMWRHDLGLLVFQLNDREF